MTNPAVSSALGLGSLYGALLVLHIPVLVIDRGSTLLSTLWHLGPTNHVGIELRSSGTDFVEPAKPLRFVSGLRPTP